VTPLAVRPRVPADLPALLAVLQRTHEQEGYPVRAAAVRADWVAAPGELDGAVAAAGRRGVGHVALHPADEREDGAAVGLWERATGRDVDGLAVVSRLFTDRTTPGAGSLLLAHAVRRAGELGRTAVLLVDPDSPARAFYARRGWREVGTAVQQWGPRTVDAVLMVPGG
jgi:GNAT superfamily N-acetyltransferase